MKLRLLFAYLLGATLLLALGSPAYAGASNCSFQAASASMAFGNLDPSAAINVTVNSTGGGWGNCGNAGQTMVMTADSGQNSGICPGGGTCMSNGSAVIPYSLTLAPNAPGPKSTYTSFTVSGTILASAYVDAPAGSYSDNVLLTVTP